MEFQRVTVQSLQIGDPLPWNIYDASGTLLLKRGEVVSSERQLSRFVESGLYVDQEEFNHSRTPITVADEPSALQAVVDARRLIGAMLDQPPDAVTDFAQRISHVAQHVIDACKLHSTVSLATILLLQEGKYTARHPVDVAILSWVLGRELGLDDQGCSVLVHAALTMNIGMYEVQEKINSIAGPLNDKLMAMIRRHPSLGQERLLKFGIDDPKWLELVRQHHENADGSGYAEGLGGEAIALGARIVGFADKYCAMVSARPYRRPQLPHTALRDLYIKQGQKIDIAVAGTMIKVVGLYPPGTLVRLKSEEIGVVTGPGNSPDTPAVHAVLGRSGSPLDVASYRKTHLADTAIIDVITIDKLAIPLRLSAIWGKRAMLK